MKVNSGIRVMGCLIPVLLAFTACEDDDYEAGSRWVDTELQIFSLDTMKVKTYTIQLDSVATSGKSLLMVGKHQDPDFGKVKANAFFQLSPEALSLNNTAIFDSVSLLLLYDSYAYGDTLSPNTIKVHPLSQRIRLNSDTGALYNTSQISYENEIGSKTYYPRPNTENRYVRISLDNSFGANLFQIMQYNDIPDVETFYQYFKGFALTYSESDNSVVRFKGETVDTLTVGGENIGSVMRIYYHYASTDGSEPEVEMFDFDISTTYQFNQFASDFSGTPLEGLTPDNPLPSESTGNKSYMQAGLGIFTRIQIPYLKNLYNIDQNIFVIDSYLNLRPVNNTYTYPYQLPGELYYYIGDRLDNLVGSFTDSSGNEVTISSYINNQFQEDNYYYVQMSGYVNSILTSQTNLENTILIYPNSTSALSLDRLVIGNQSFYQNQLEFNVSLIKY